MVSGQGYCDVVLGCVTFVCSLPIPLVFKAVVFPKMCMESYNCFFCGTPILPIEGVCALSSMALGGRHMCCCCRKHSLMLVCCLLCWCWESQQSHNIQSHCTRNGFKWKWVSTVGGSAPGRESPAKTWNDKTSLEKERERERERDHWCHSPWKTQNCCLSWGATCSTHSLFRLLTKDEFKVSVVVGVKFTVNRLYICWMSHITCEIAVIGDCVFEWIKQSL